MNWKEFYNLAQNSIAFSDGAMGSLLQQIGLTSEDCPEIWNVTRAEDIYSVHKQYVDVGSMLLTTNTLGGNRIKLSYYNAVGRLKELNEAGVRNAKRAANGKAIVAASVGPTGKFIEPLGELTFDEMVEIYKEQIEVLANAGADAIDFETHVDLLELKAAMIACREICDLPMIANMTFDSEGRTVTGTPPEAAFTMMEALGAAVIGTNCSTGPDKMAEIIARTRGLFDLPMIAQANAGMPHIHQGKTVFDETPDSFSGKAIKLVDLHEFGGANIIGGCCGTTPEHMARLIAEMNYSGVNVIGGCCGTTPSHIARLIESTKNTKFNRSDVVRRNFLKISSRYRIVLMSHDEPFVVIGERLNPTARKKLAEDIKSGEFSMFKDEALAQEAAGAAILDMNMGIPGADEPALIKKGVEILSNTIQAPFAIDTSNPEAARIGMRLYPGKPLLNSISAEADRLELLKDIKKYGAAFIALPIDERGIPETSEGRIKLMRKIIGEAERLGIDKKNIIGDPLVLTVSAQQAGAKVTLETIRRYKTELEIYSSMGLSNISFGLPARGNVNRAFLNMAISEGLTSAIMNPMDADVMGLVRASDVLLSKDANSKEYIRVYSEIDKQSASAKTDAKSDSIPVTVGEKMYDAVLKGSKGGILPLIEQALDEKMSAIEILNNHLIMAINKVGELYEKRIYFLPQLMMSAETMKAAFGRLEPLLLKESQEPKGKIVIATVKGDVHDIGKNIVIIMLQNKGFQVIDMGKDIPNEEILRKAKEVGADIVGLSALMTTTMPRMEEFMQLAEGEKFRVMVGGAAVTPGFAEGLGAYYAADAVNAVKLAEKIMG
jgi:5-methyltetrahydrofolate--homocysteine methyltransferase